MHYEEGGKLLDWKAIVAIGASLAVILYPIVRWVHLAVVKQITQEVIDELEELLNKALLPIARDQKKIEIETRGNRARANQLSDFLQEILVDTHYAKRLKATSREIETNIDKELEQADNEYQNKMERPNNDRRRHE